MTHTWAVGGAHVSSPGCVNCGEETEHDGDRFCCYDCGLSWDGNDPERPGERDEEYDGDDNLIPTCDFINPHPHTPPDKVIAGKMRRYLTSPCLLNRGHATPYHYHETAWVAA